MRILEKQRTYLSILVSLVIAATFSLGTISASVSGDAIDESITDDLMIPQVLTGALTAKGTVLVNGNETKTGATVAQGSVIQTQGGAEATIDLGATGRVQLDQLTAIVLNWTGNSIEAKLEKCGMGVTLVQPSGVSGRVRIQNIGDVGVLKTDREVDVRVYRGEATVKYGQGKERFLKAGDHREFDNAIEATSTGDTTFKVYCDENHYPYLLWAGLAGIFIPVGEAVTGNGPIAPVVSPSAP